MRFKKDGMNNYFDSVQDIIKEYSDGHIRPLRECCETIKAYRAENEKSNPYRLVAANFEKYNNSTAGQDESDGYYFYEYLKSLGKDDEYSFPLKNGKIVTAKVNLFEPYEDIGNGEKIIKPQWHLFVAYYAYLDAAYNHLENHILEKTGWNYKDLKREVNRTINLWIQEARIKK